MKKAIFLDRDNTLIEDEGYIHEPEKVKLLPTVGEGLKLLKEKGFLLIVVSNQSGIGRGYFKEEDFHAVNKKLNSLLKENFNVEIDDFFFCPHKPDDNCLCRKPKTLLFKKAAEKWKINISESFMIGDKEIDVEAGKNAGCKRSFLAKDKLFIEIVKEILEKI
ncbi:D-glycero-alpha-D-manno-heptose-1,7-bisphosphate 7-phosphatase [Desulfurobacterium atlanticum]|uniref:D,D-heptose 1,7-bisphosphate phosphatase n=1 Tax=Desulfurobacterium atlanticum TaxID=240169 RepID=A0A239A031_9BACT|nr:HAD family hydrolase [Desulfurobacterium atlanticum]SNR88374.1 D-glycero-D-manno-heptose 1,7-bisphosphate phosphatase [Desulfurobacterium atlanticum]